MWGSSRGSVGGVRWGDQREVHNRARTGLHGFLHRVGRCHLYEVYAEGPARPTGGAAAIAMLIGPNAPIAFETKLRGTHMSHIYDFYKLNLANEYPVVDGKLSQTCYLLAVDSCYKRFCSKYEKLEGKQFSILDADYVAFHSPYNKISFLCRKALPGSYSTTFCGMSVRSTRMLKRSLHHLQACLVMKVIRTVVLKRSNGPPWF